MRYHAKFPWGFLMLQILFCLIMFNLWFSFETLCDQGISLVSWGFNTFVEALRYSGRP